jgi:soluble lytic murein transglycosylase
MSRRALGSLVAVALVALTVAVAVSALDTAVRRVGLPLSHASIIRQQASLKHLDPALIAAVIYSESKFDPRPSPAGAEGLMQILPETAYFIARRSGGSQFTASDLATPSINVAYGSYYLRYLLDHYGGNEMLALAAYNGGIANVDSWVARGEAAGKPLTLPDIPFSETRAYVLRVLKAQQAYRARYPRELGLA